MTRVLRADRRGPAHIPHSAISAAERAGYAAGLERARAELAATWVELAAARDRALAELEPQTLEVALAAARQLLGETIAVHPERMTELVQGLLGRVRRARTIALHLHPEDAASLRAWLDHYGERHTAATLHLETDPAITRGGCVVRSDVGTLDARVETRVSALQSALERLRHPP